MFHFKVLVEDMLSVRPQAVGVPRVQAKPGVAVYSEDGEATGYA